MPGTSVRGLHYDPHMPIRSDFTLECQLLGTRDQARADGIKAAIVAALSHMGDGYGRRGGRRLLELLNEALNVAESEGEVETLERLEDSIGYATGNILRPDFDEKYPIHGNPVRDEGWRKMLAHVVSDAYGLAVFKLEEHLKKAPEADSGDLLAHLRSLAEDARFLDAPESTPGRYRIVRGRAELAEWVRLVLRDRIDIEDGEEELRRLVSSPEALLALAADEDGKTLLKAVELQRRQSDLSALRKLIEDPTASEADLQRSLQDQYWIFGGQFIGAAARRTLVLGSEVDIPLLRADGALHIVELKCAMNLPSGFVTRHGGVLVPNAQVHHAVSQAINYLVRLDENRHQIRAEFGIETRRASALVLIGHPALHPDVPEDEINDALRVFNSHISRIEVLTYKTLVDSAMRSLGGEVVVGPRRSRGAQPPTE